ncbi:caM kinase-like vesicle-associated protein [Portunus trituberculatus]|uniref:caM kinase-like vesicle-associated protein n=1 Tax=Portunus trituberculatus TaxID=210409 RepID=UPI001E1D12BE|nr:caM kinase-like vesicle-associated protein [Portunus trituberculatus]XP_045107880.1 caM kinase-like vesicle-associated protein [Portunus trituberculatus]
MEIERAHRVGKQSEQRDRPVIVRFSRFSDREAVLRNCPKLRGTNIYINEDLPLTSQAIKRVKMPLLRQARNEGKIAYFRHTKLIVKERPGAVGGEGGVASGGSGNRGSRSASDTTASAAAEPIDGTGGATAVHSDVAATTSSATAATADSAAGVDGSAASVDVAAADAAVNVVASEAGDRQRIQTRKGKTKK